MTHVIHIAKDGSGNSGLQPCAVVPQEAVLSGETHEQGEVHLETKDGALTVGTWECTPYAENLSCSDYSEFATILSGKVALTNPDGSVDTFGAGESYVIPAGWQGRFEVLETLRKTYVIVAA